MTWLVSQLGRDAFFAAIEQLRHPEYRGRPPGIECSPNTLGRERTFQGDLSEECGLRSGLRELVDSAIARLRVRGLRARNVTVELWYADFDTHARGPTLPAATDERALIGQAAQLCLAGFAMDRGIRLIEVRGRLAADRPAWRKG